MEYEIIEYKEVKNYETEMEVKLINEGVCDWFGGCAGHYRVVGSSTVWHFVQNFNECNTLLNGHFYNIWAKLRHEGKIK